MVTSFSEPGLTGEADAFSNSSSSFFNPSSAASSGSAATASRRALSVASRNFVVIGVVLNETLMFSATLRSFSDLPANRVTAMRWARFSRCPLVLIQLRLPLA